MKTLDERASASRRRSQIRGLEEKLISDLEFEGIVGRSPATLEALITGKLPTLRHCFSAYTRPWLVGSS